MAVRLVHDGGCWDLPFDQVLKNLEFRFNTIHPLAVSQLGPVDESARAAAAPDAVHKTEHVVTIKGSKIAASYNPPFEERGEVIGGPLTGSRFVSYYAPKDDKTCIVTIGDFEPRGIDPDELTTVVYELLSEFFAEEYRAAKSSDRH